MNMFDVDFNERENLETLDPAIREEVLAVPPSLWRGLASDIRDEAARRGPQTDTAGAIDASLMATTQFGFGKQFTFDLEINLLTGERRVCSLAVFEADGFDVYCDRRFGGEEVTKLFQELCGLLCPGSQESAQLPSSPVDLMGRGGATHDENLE